MDSHTHESESESPIRTSTAVSEGVRDFLREAKKQLNTTISAVLASRCQQVMFVGFARFNAPVVAIVSCFASAILAHCYPFTLMWVLPLAITEIALLSMFVRVRKEKSLMMTSVYGRTLRVHLPRTQLSSGDTQSLAGLLQDVVRLARRARANTISFDSPLLVSVRTSSLLASHLRQAAVAEKINIAVETRHAQEVGSLRQRAFAQFAQDYSRLRSVRLEVGPNGRYLSRCILVRFER